MPAKHHLGALYVVDASLCEDRDINPPIPCAVYRDITRHKDSFYGGVKYVLEGEGSFNPSDYDRDYLETIYRRLMKIPLFILETQRCIVRETCKEDLDSFFKIYSDRDVSEYVEPLMERIEEEKYTENYRDLIYEIYGHGIWTVILKETGEIIGRAGLDERADFDTPELGFLIGKKWQGQGLGYEVCSEILKWGASEGMSKIMSLADKANAPSVTLLNKLGFKESEDVKVNDEILTKYTLSLIHPECGL